MTNMIVDIMVEVLTILAVAANETSTGRFGEFIPGISPFLMVVHKKDSL
jgi:hypothetical protein